jgi:pimeloyl-ACP methyl ester carboxylesterase/class 3 adenylate cyclase
MDAPETRYAKNGDVHLAYQVIGDGPQDLLFLVAGGNHADLQWEEPGFARFLTRLASFSRLIVYDLRGSGLSDRTGEVPAFEHQMDDALAVLDAAGSAQTALLAYSQAGPLGALLAATYPDRFSPLMFYASYARTLWAPDYPWGRRPEIWAALMDMIENAWGTDVLADLISPSKSKDPEYLKWFVRFQRATASPGEVRRLLEMWSQTDVRAILGSIRVPTLVLHRVGDNFREMGHSRYLAEHIPGARLIELPGIDHVPFVGETGPLLDEIQEFVTGAKPVADADRVLATVVFADIVNSTGHAARLGDHAWRGVLEDYYGLVRRQLERFRGREVKTVGDAVLATFDGPARAVRCARAVADGFGTLGLEVHAGVHTGECEVIGQDLGGLAVHVGARVADLAGRGEVLASSTVKDLTVGSGISFEDRGMHELRGVPGEWRLYAVASA